MSDFNTIFLVTLAVLVQQVFTQTTPTIIFGVSSKATKATTVATTKAPKPTKGK